MTGLRFSDATIFKFRWKKKISGTFYSDGKATIDYKHIA